MMTPADLPGSQAVPQREWSQLRRDPDVGLDLLHAVFTTRFRRIIGVTPGAYRAALRAVPSERLALAGIALRAERKQVDAVVKGLALHQ
jgi:hypothetical protein